MKHPASSALLASALITGIFGVATAGHAATSKFFPSADASEVLEAEPVGRQKTIPAVTSDEASAWDDASKTGNAQAGQPRYVPYIPRDFSRPHLLLPYSFTAYIPQVDRTELNLGLLLSQSPGVDVALGWGAVEHMMISARISALGASSTVGLGLKYLLLPEEADASEPAIAVVARGLFLNHRTLGGIRENIFRGSRIQSGVVITKDLGVLATSLNAGRTLREFLSALRLNGEALLEYRTGRDGAGEAPVNLLDAGAKLSLEATLRPDVAYAYLVLDTSPDWIGDLNYYLGGRYYSNPDLAFDALLGRIQNSLGILVTISWIF